MSERAALPSGVAYVDMTNKAPLKRVVVRRWLRTDWIEESLVCGHKNVVYRPPWTPQTAKRRCCLCGEGVGL